MAGPQTHTSSMLNEMREMRLVLMAGLRFLGMVSLRGLFKAKRDPLGNFVRRARRFVNISPFVSSDHLPLRWMFHALVTG
jgi:hypothetical protein